jgi:hypothetical protein
MVSRDPEQGRGRGGAEEPGRGQLPGEDGAGRPLLPRHQVGEGVHPSEGVQGGRGEGLQAGRGREGVPVRGGHGPPLLAQQVRTLKDCVTRYFGFFTFVDHDQSSQRRYR